MVLKRISEANEETISVVKCPMNVLESNTECVRKQD